MFNKGDKSIHHTSTQIVFVFDVEGFFARVLFNAKKHQEPRPFLGRGQAHSGTNPDKGVAN
jgi:hypothetical protein